MLASTRGLAIGPDNARQSDGAGVVVESLAASRRHHRSRTLGYRSAWESFRLVGAKGIGGPVDSEGLQIDGLERLIAQQRVRDVYVTPHHQYPTSPATDSTTTATSAPIVVPWFTTIHGHVDRRSQVGHQMRIAAVDAEDGEKTCASGWTSC